MSFGEAGLPVRGGVIAGQTRHISIRIPIHLEKHRKTIIEQTTIFLKEEIRNILIDEAKQTVDDAKSRCPVKTGALRNSIAYRETVTGAQILVDTSYWKYQEFGTRHITPKLFMTDSFSASVDRIRKRVEMLTLKTIQEIEAMVGYSKVTPTPKEPSFGEVRDYADEARKHFGG